MSDYLEFYRKVNPASIQAGRNVYVKVSILIDDFNAALEHYGFVKERTCKNVDDEFPFFKCSECECNAVVGYGSSGDGLPNYCPNCGARVVSE